MKTYLVPYLRLLLYCLGLLSWFANSLFNQATFPFENGVLVGILELTVSLPDGGLERIVGLIIGALVGASLLIFSMYSWDEDKRSDWLFTIQSRSFAIVLWVLICLLELYGLLMSVVFSFLSIFSFALASSETEVLNYEKFLASFALLFWSLSLGLSIYHHGLGSRSYKKWVRIFLDD